MVRLGARGDVEDRAVRGPIEALVGASGPPDAPSLPTDPLDTGNRPESNTCSGGLGEVADGEVNVHLGNHGSGKHPSIGATLREEAMHGEAESKYEVADQIVAFKR